MIPISLPIKVTVGSVPDSYTPPDDMQGLLEAIPKFTTYELADDGANIRINADGANATFDGLWVQMLNQYKLPPMLRTGYRNSWWEVYTGKPGEIRPLVAAWSSYFDGSGRAYQWPGWEGWCLCNGQNGTVNLSNMFSIPGYRNDGAGWITNITGTDNYYYFPATHFQIGYEHLPANVVLHLVNTDFFKWTRYGGGGFSTVVSQGEQNARVSNANYQFWTYPLDQSYAMRQWPISRIPPYIAVGYAQFMGYL